MRIEIRYEDGDFDVVGPNAFATHMDRFIKDPGAAPDGQFQTLCHQTVMALKQLQEERRSIEMKKFGEWVDQWQAAQRLDQEARNANRLWARMLRSVREFFGVEK